MSSHGSPQQPVPAIANLSVQTIKLPNNAVRHDSGPVKEFQLLRNSIARHGLLQPVVVRENSLQKSKGACAYCGQTVRKLASGVLSEHDATDFRCPGSQLQPGDTYELVIGSRRLAAYKDLGYQHIPAIIRADFRNEVDRVSATITENSTHLPLSLIEEATIFEQLRQNGNEDWETAQIASRPKAYIGHVLDLLRRGKTVRQEIHRGRVSLREWQKHGR